MGAGQRAPDHRQLRKESGYHTWSSGKSPLTLSVAPHRLMQVMFGVGNDNVVFAALQLGRVHVNLRQIFG